MKWHSKALLAGVMSLAMTQIASAVEFNMSIWFPDVHPLARYGYIEWAEAMKKAPNGELSPVVFTGSSLLAPKAHLSGLRDGITQVSFHAGSYTPAETPEDNVVAGLGLSMSEYFETAFAVTDFYINDPEMQAMFDRNGVVFGSAYATPPYRLICTSAVETPEDIRGKSIRVPTAVLAAWASSVGAVPVAIPSSETYTGLEKGQLDCTAASTNDLKTASLWDVAKHVTMVNLGSISTGWLHGFNKDFWKGLTKEQREIIFDTMADANVAAAIGYLETAESAEAAAAAHKVAIHEPSPELSASITKYAQTVARKAAIEDGENKFGLSDSEGLIKRFEATVAKWKKLLAGVDRRDRQALANLLKNEVYKKIDFERYGTE